MRNEEFIRSYVRVKPAGQEESGSLWCSDNEVRINKTRETFSFNRVFNQNAQNDVIYDQAISPIINDLLKGYNACVLAYGQTSSGKTFTMKGVSISLGLIPLSIKEIFGRIEERGMMAKVKISYFQIYNENIIDLLMSDQQVRYLELREDGRKNLVVVDLIEQEVRDEYEALSHYQRGELKRKFASNSINFSSSRSHTIFKVTLSTVTEDSQLVESSIYMVDLAGSESISKTNAVGVLKKEAENINKSLLALTTAIRAISERQAYVNYRNSKLTRILQPCLSGNSKTIVICTIKQSEECLAETINTLKFGVSANTIRTDARLNILQEKDEGRFKELTKLLEEERNARAYLQSQMVKQNGELEIRKMRIDQLDTELNECKHRLFAMENENRHHSQLIDYYRAEEQKEKKNLNIFQEKAKGSIALIEADNKNLKISIRNLEETIDNRNKKIAMLQKNERSLLEKIEKYEKQLGNLQKIATQTQEKGRTIEASKKEPQRPNNQSNRNPPKTKVIPDPLTIGTCIQLSTTILRMKIDMNHYLNTIADLHNQINELQARLDDISNAKQISSGLEQKKGRRQSGARTKEDDKKIRKLEFRVHELKQANAKLQKKNSHYMKILKKCANNNINSIAGFNDYIEKNFKYNQRALFEELMHENADDYAPIILQQRSPSKRTENEGYQPREESRRNDN